MIYNITLLYPLVHISQFHLVKKETLLFLSDYNTWLHKFILKFRYEIRMKFMF